MPGFPTAGDPHGPVPVSVSSMSYTLSSCIQTGIISVVPTIISITLIFMGKKKNVLLFKYH